MNPSEIEAYLTKKERDGLLYPQYQDFSLYNAVCTTLNFFGFDEKESLPLPRHFTKKTKKVVFFLIDGFGFSQYKKIALSYDFFKAVKVTGCLFPITTVFPSTTASALTTVATALTPQEHGLFEWNLYLPEIDEVVQTLPFAPLGKNAQAESLRERGIPGEVLFKINNTIFKRLKKKGVRSYVFRHASITGSTYSSLVSKDAQTIGYSHLSDLLGQLKALLENEKGPAFFYVYWADIDSQGHRFGPDSYEYNVESMLFFDALWKGLVQSMDKAHAADTVLLLTADHGQVPVDPQKTIYLSSDTHFQRFLAKSPRGKTILPWGSPRDIFIMCKKDVIRKAYAYLNCSYGDKAHILFVKEAIEKNLFGVKKPSTRFLERCGDIILLPKKNDTIWYEHIAGEFFNLRGHHGGLTKEEMLIPFCMAYLEDIV